MDADEDIDVHLLWRCCVGLPLVIEASGWKWRSFSQIIRRKALPAVSHATHAGSARAN